MWDLVLVAILGIILGLCIYNRTTEGFADYKDDAIYKEQIKLLSDTYLPTSDGRKSVLGNLDRIPEEEQIFTNYHALGCRFTGFIGPTTLSVLDKKNASYYDPDIAVQMAVAAGCRVFVLEIDFIGECPEESKYFPTLVVKHENGILVEKQESLKQLCNSPTVSQINEVCQKINTYAFATSCQNADDPVVLVLYFLNVPPGLKNSSTVLTYYTQVANAIQPLRDHFLGNETSGIYYRQREEGQLLINPIKEYKGKVLVFSNADTSGFRDGKYSEKDDLDYYVNLRLSYTQTKLGVTDNTAGATFGILETVEDFLTIPSDREVPVVDNTKLKWTICFTKNPLQSITPEDYKKITSTYGVHCIPMILYDIPTNQYLFTDKLFKTYSYIPKPDGLRYKRPPLITAGKANQQAMDTNGGQILTPTTPSNLPIVKN